MTVATEVENNPDTKEIKDVKEMKEALKDDSPPDNKQQDEAAKESAKKDDAQPKKDETTAEAQAQAKSVTVHKADFEKDIVYLYQFTRTPRLPSISPYCLKVETWLRLNGIKYEVSILFFCFLYIKSFFFCQISQYNDSYYNSAAGVLLIFPL